MTNEKNAAGAAAANRMFAGGTEWAKLFLEGPFKTYATLSREVLAIAARSIQTQADFIKKLSECSRPEDVLSCQSEFARKGLSNYVEEGQHLMDIVRTNYMDSTKNE